MSINWTLQNVSTTGETQWSNASYNLSFNIPDNATAQTDFLEIAGYTSGTISFTIAPDPDSGGGGWAPNSTLEISIIGGIDGTFAAPVSAFTVQTLEIKNTDSGTTFYIEWNIPIQFVRLFVDNNTTISTGLPIRVSNIRLQTESEGGGLGFTSSSGATVGPGGSTPQVQFNDGGIFGGASGVLYDKTANTNTGQIQLAAGTVGEPMLSFSDGIHPAGNYDTGIYRQGVNQLGISAGGGPELVVSAVNHVSADGGAAATPGFNFGITATDTNTGMYRVQPDTLGIATGGIQQVTVTASAAPIPVGMIRGLNIGTTGNVTGIRRLSAAATNSWEDGNCGNSEFIVFTAADFAGAFSNPLTPAGRGQTFVTWSTASAARSPVVYNGLNPGPAIACKLIPKGFVIDSGDRALCFIYSDIVTGGAAPQEMNIDVRVQTAAGPNIDAPLQIAFETIPAAGAGWQTAGDGSVNRTIINIPAFGGATTAAATGTGFNTINIFVEPTAAMSQTTGGIVAFKVPIKRI